MASKMGRFIGINVIIVQNRKSSSLSINELIENTYLLVSRVGSGVVRIDPLR